MNKYLLGLALLFSSFVYGAASDDNEINIEQSGDTFSLHIDQIGEFIKKLMDNQLLTIRAAENVVRILPPLNVKKNEIDLAIKIIEKVCSKIK